MKRIDIIDESFDINSSASYHISLEMSDEGIRYAIMDTIRRKYIALRCEPFDLSPGLSREDQLKKYLERDIYFNGNYKSAGLIYATMNSALIPNSLYGEENKEKLFRFTNPLAENQLLITNRPATIDATLIFSLPAGINRITEGHKIDFKLLHHSIPFIEKSARDAKNDPGRPIVSAQVFPGFLDVVVFKNGNFELFNSFRYKSVSDLVFYILYVFEQVEINPAKGSICLSGCVEDDSGTADELRKYIPKLEFDNFNRNYEYSYTFGQLKEHHYSNLINVAACV